METCRSGLRQFIPKNQPSQGKLRGVGNAHKPLGTDHVRRLESLWSLQKIELHGLALIQRAVAILLNGGKVDENVLSRGSLNKPIAFRPVEPLYCSLLSHKKLLSPLLSDLSIQFPHLSRFESPSRNAEAQMIAAPLSPLSQRNAKGS